MKKALLMLVVTSLVFLISAPTYGQMEAEAKNTARCAEGRVHPTIPIPKVLQRDQTRYHAMTAMVVNVKKSLQTVSL